MSGSGPSQRRPQRTIQKPVETAGIGFLTGADVTIRFLPAEPNHGIAFQRTDCPGSEPVPALIEYAVPRRRRTAIEHRGVAVDLIEHVMAALAGLHIDNCLVQLNAAEPPGCDGSALAFVEALMSTEFVEQNAVRPCVSVDRLLRVSDDSGRCDVTARPLTAASSASAESSECDGHLTISYQLDYGPQSPIPPQAKTISVTPTSFVNELAFARTFVLESEAQALRAQGYGRRTTAQDLLVFGDDGVIDNRLRAPDECARHKLLDCVGDFALLGCDVCGHFSAVRSGHRLNRAIIRRLKAWHSNSCGTQERRAA